MTVPKSRIATVARRHRTRSQATVVIPALLPWQGGRVPAARPRVSHPPLFCLQRAPDARQPRMRQTAASEGAGA